MNFELGDEVVYNPNIPDLPPANLRPCDWGKIMNISNGYIHLKFTRFGSIHRILPSSVSHSPRSPKYFRSVLADTIRNIPVAALNKKMRKFKNIYQSSLRDAMKIAMKKDCEREFMDFLMSEDQRMHRLTGQ